MKKILKYILLSILTVAVAYYISLIVAFNYDLKQDFKTQAERLAALRTTPHAAVAEQDFVDFDILNNTLKLNEIQVLATHNSFKAMPNMYINKPLEILFGQKVRNGQYGLPYLTDQLDSGIRGVELDITVYDDDFILMHDPITDWRTTGASFALALEEIKIWSETNENHIPINIMIQIRDRWSPFSLKYGDFDKDKCIKLDKLLEDTFGDENIIKPSDVIGDYDNLKAAVEGGNWPTVNDSLGKVYFTLLIDDENIRQDYIDIDESYKTQKAFMFSKKEAGLDNYSAFILADEPDEEGLPELVGKNYILRTRIDLQHQHSEERYNATLSLGAVIIATDYPEGNSYKDGYVCKLTDDGKTVIERT